MRLGAVLTVFNEERNLRPCLESLRGFDELIVVDSGSSDATRAIAESYGALVLQFPDIGNYDDRAYELIIAKQRYGVSQSKADWILIIDADERFPVRS